MLRLRIRECCTAPGWTITNANRPGNFPSFCASMPFVGVVFFTLPLQKSNFQTSIFCNQLQASHCSATFRLSAFLSVSLSLSPSVSLRLSLSPSLARSLSLSLLNCLSRFFVCSASPYTTCFSRVQLQCHWHPYAVTLEPMSFLCNSYVWGYVCYLFVWAPQRCWPGKATLSRGRTQILESPKPTLAHSNFPKCPRTHCRIQWQLEEGGPYVSRIERMRALTYHWMYLSLHLRMGAKGRLDYSWETATMDLTCT